MQAGTRFRGSLASHTGIMEKEGAESFIKVKVAYECSQASLDAVVKSLYSRSIHLGVENCMEIVGVADYLQVPLLPLTRIAIINIEIPLKHHK